MNPWWLLLIVPVAAGFGFGLCSLLVIASRADAMQERSPMREATKGGKA